MNPGLVLIYGPPLSGKTTLAWALARALDGPAAVVSSDSLTAGAIAVPGPDPRDELEMVHIQQRLLVANYLKNRYHTVVEGPFLYERDGALISYEADIDQMAALMRNLTRRTLIVRLDAPEAVLRARAAAAGRDDELSLALRLAGAYRERYGERFHRFDTAAMPPEEIVVVLRQLLDPDGGL